MTLALVVFGIVSLLELCIFMPFAWPLRRFAASCVVFFLSLSSGALLVARPSVLACLIFLANLYRIFNLMRIVKGRMHQQYLRRVTFLTSLSVMAIQAVALLLWGLEGVAHISRSAGWTSLALVQLVWGLVLYLAVRLQWQRMQPVLPHQQYPRHDLPAVTICIPARNETEALQECLAALLLSDYPKLEILVLDDCSQNRQTSEIIKSFAHNGVRFLKGKEPAKTWLAKNQAYEHLYEAASGDILLFCGVDLRVKPDSVRMLVTTMLSGKLAMLSLMPENRLPAGFASSLSLVLQPLRYAWELAIPRRLLQRPPVLSTCWLIRRQALADAGSFAAVSRSVVPERYFAKVTNRNGGYAFLASDADIAITTNKSATEQFDTAVRTRYPQLHRRPETVLLVTLAEIFGLLAPAVLCIVAFATGRWVLALVSLAATICIVLTYIQLVRITYRTFMWRSLLGAPFAAAADIAVLHYAMYKYEFSEVYWKGRNVCLPVMHVVPRLPKV